MLRKKIGEVANGPRLSSALKEMTKGAVDRRTFIKRSGLAVGGIGAAAALTGGRVQKAQAAADTEAKFEIKNSIFPNCSVGCTFMAVVQNGVCIGQEPGFSSPFNLDLKSVVEVNCGG